MAAESNPSNRRRRLIINAPLQLRLAGILVLSVCTLAGVILGAIYVSLGVILYTFELQRDQIMVLLFRNVGLLVTIAVLCCALVSIWVLFWVAIVYTHRIAGPLVRVMAAVEQMAHGNFDVHLSLRKGDGLQDLAEDINRLAAYLRSRSLPPSE